MWACWEGESSKFPVPFAEYFLLTCATRAIYSFPLIPLYDERTEEASLGNEKE